ncbi:MAG: 30S ribosomal protein S3 [Victivallales bacterium]|nr:30S ribosomal protein S3 [Victivallales bacterium]MCF7889191.1 30S ribosomal protein S3 [Victivallales bacterium]
MGQKINPISFRVATSKDWDSKWFAKKTSFGSWLHEDLKLRNYVKKEFKHAAISRVVIHRASNRIALDIYSARPGILASRKGEFEKLQNGLSSIAKSHEIKIDIHEVKNPERNAQLVAENIALQLERRVGFRRAMKRAIQLAMDSGALGIKVKAGGRLGGAELARNEEYKEGKTPLHTIRANVGYGFAEANTTAGKIGVKVWICNPKEKKEK